MKKEPPNLLTADDSTAIRKILLRVLSQTDLVLGQILEAGDGKEALRQMESRDLAGPFGHRHAEHGRSRTAANGYADRRGWHDLPVVIITTEDGQARVEEIIALGATSYVRKPFSADLLRDQLAALLSK